MCRFNFALAIVLAAIGTSPAMAEPDFRIASFTAEITIPIGHRCMGILPTKAERIEDPLEAHGFVLLGADRPIVLVALDWCELRNGAYDHWRETLAEAAGTRRDHVLICCLHQHDAPVVDTDAQMLLDRVGLEKELCDPRFQEDCLQRLTRALGESLPRARRVTHLGLGEAKVARVASSRRVRLADGRVTFDRSSASGGVPLHRDAPEGDIDPFLKTLSFWNGEQPILALHAYAVHPMSYYGRGGVTADFVGLARRRRQADDPQVAQIYVTGCAGDVTAGKYNDGSTALRSILAERIYQAMKEAWSTTRRVPLTTAHVRIVPVELPFHEGAEFKREAMTEVLQDRSAPTAERILAAMGLASLDRIERKQPIELACVDLGEAQIVLFPGETFVGYQLLAQRLRPDSFLFSIGYGECWPGYVPTATAFEERFDHGWRWCGPASPERLSKALREAVAP